MLILIGCLTATGLSWLRLDELHGRGGRQYQDEQRDVYYDYRRARPAKTRGGRPRGTVAKAKTPPRYVRRSPRTSESTPGLRRRGTFRKLGVTIWRLRPSKADEAEEVRVIDDKAAPGTSALTPVRVAADTELSPGDRVRLSIESPMAGYLYVINRESYGDDGLGAPYLIFPNMLTRGGENRVRAGVLVDLPANGEEPGFFRLSPTRAAQAGELLIIIVSARPLSVPPLKLKRTPLDAARVERWVKEWGNLPTRFELEGGAGSPWTREERAAALGETRELIQDDPGPQTIFMVHVRGTYPLLVSLPLLYGKK